MGVAREIWLESSGAGFRAVGANRPASRPANPARLRLGGAGPTLRCGWSFSARNWSPKGSTPTKKPTFTPPALVAALTAMREAAFSPGGSRLEADADLPQVIAAHTTPVLKTEAAKVTSMTALKCYFTFAQEQFAAAAGHEVAGSMALHALGKLHDAMGQEERSFAGGRAQGNGLLPGRDVAYPKNFIMANDLGGVCACAWSSTGARHDVFATQPFALSAVGHLAATWRLCMANWVRCFWRHQHVELLQQAETARTAFAWDGQQFRPMG